MTDGGMAENFVTALYSGGVLNERSAAAYGVNYSSYQ
jgi:hypothetical protein